MKVKLLISEGKEELTLSGSIVRRGADMSQTLWVNGQETFEILEENLKVPTDGGESYLDTLVKDLNTQNQYYVDSSKLNMIKGESVYKEYDLPLPPQGYLCSMLKPLTTGEIGCKGFLAPPVF